LLINFADRFGYKARSAPATFIGSRHWVGFTSQIAGEITDQIRNLRHESMQRTRRIIWPVRRPTPSGNAEGRQTRPIAAVQLRPQQNETQVILDVPVFGRILLTKGALWANTALIAFADGFNPCSLWVLTMLLALIIHTVFARQNFSHRLSCFLRSRLSFTPHS
jgi:hypothetical protein